MVSVKHNHVYLLHLLHRDNMFRPSSAHLHTTQNKATRTANCILIIYTLVGRVAQSVQRLSTGWTVRGSNSGGGRDFLHLSRPALGPTQPPVQWVPGLSQGVKSGRGVTLNPHPLLVPWSRKSRAIVYSPYGPYGLYRVSVPVQGCTLPLLCTR